MSAAFDYIVVGAGSAGAAVAAGLSAGGDASVLLLEAGDADTKTEVHIPAAFSKLFRTTLDWNYDTEPQTTLGGRSIYWPRGRMLGGSSSLNAMMWVRGFAADYDGWARTAGESWSWRALLPYFDRVERTMRVERQRSPRSHTARFLSAVREAGYAVVTPNLDNAEGFSETLVNQRSGARFSAADAYLKPARRRANLTVTTGAHVTRVLFEGTRAVGVEYLHGGSTRTATTRREVVVSGGAVNTPQLLMLSGIGPAEELQRHGIAVLVDSAEVGSNLSDHLLSGLIVPTAGDTLFTAQSAGSVVGYLTRRRGMLSSNVAEAYGFVRTREELELPDVEIIFAPVAFVDEGLVEHPAHGLTIGAILLQPKSRGTIRLRSTDPLEKAVIDPGYLTDSGGEDRATLLAGIALCDEILAQPALAEVVGKGYVRPLGAETLSREERAVVALEKHAHTLYHPVGTARMGTDSGSVVDEQLRVRGVDGLRVADASVMPSIIRGHTHAPSLVIGEKAVDLILGG
ncbi:glucose-methanol-choline oxidoreductase [Glaciihabitans arcticus]|uniref:Glucose-methanol-choline oxidoreductase n=1 Tax=Glaciihabitans arcticus TaxID=2668039 RepID=A0A4Q9GPU6_9MICO|nr:FAD-dependent oxidoreductase [Glaciihabitans arcticus]TBN56836.1 glucose-methanol-choline oxidoreductase [Glaciihabitans arcticus]